MRTSRIFRALSHNTRRCLSTSSFSTTRFALKPSLTQTPIFQNPTSYSLSHLADSAWRRSNSIFASCSNIRFLNTSSTENINDNNEIGANIVKKEESNEYETDGEGPVEWEEEEEGEPELGDGGDGGGVVLQNVFWGEQTLSIAREVLMQFGDGIELFSFKTTPRGYIYVRLDKLSHKYGCPSMEEIESYSQQYKKRLDEAGAHGEIPDNLALEVSSPGAERLLKVPDDLSRFKDLIMMVCYVEEVESKCHEKNGVFLLDSIETESESCVWKLADVRENRDPLGKGRPLSRQRKDWRLKLPYAMVKRVSLYINFS